nr:hypothetical protein [Tanacetum cinerariifolium]
AASDKEMELWVELKRLYEPDAEDQLWTHTQNLMHALVEWKLYDTCGVHHMTSKDKEIFMLVEKDYPLKKGLAIVMICYKLQIIILFWKLDCSWSIKFRGGLLGIKCTRHSHYQLWSSYCQKKFPLPVKKVPTARRKEMPLLSRFLALETDLRRTKKVYGTVSDDEEDSEDSSKHGRILKDIDQDARITLVTHAKVSRQEYQPKDQLGVLSAAEVIADAAKKKVNTYTKRRRPVSTGSEGVSTASRIFSTAEESVKTVGESMPVSTADVVQECVKDKEEQARFNAEQEAKFNAKQEKLLASETTKDRANPSVTDVD